MIDEYDQHRTVDDMIRYLQRNTGHSIEIHQDAIKDKKFVDKGCQVVGGLEVARVPGNFYLMAISKKSQSIDPTMANLTHIVHHLSMGDPIPQNVLSRLSPEDRKGHAPLDGMLA